MQRWDEAPGLSRVVIKTPLSCFHIALRASTCVHSPCISDRGRVAADSQQKGSAWWFGPGTPATRGAWCFAA